MTHCALILEIGIFILIFLIILWSVCYVLTEWHGHSPDLKRQRKK